MSRIFSETDAGVLVAVLPKGSFRALGELRFPPITEDSGSRQTIIITRISIQQGAVFQIQESLDNLLYVYAFGESVGRVELSGIGVHHICTSGGSKKPTIKGFVGLLKLLKMYENHSISASGDPIKLSIGDKTLETYLIGYRADSGDPSARFIHFTLSLIFPQKRFGGKQGAAQ